MIDAQQGRAFTHGEQSALESNATQDCETDQQWSAGENIPTHGNGIGEQAGAVLGVQDTEGICRKLEPKWTYRLRDTITSTSDADWRLVLHCLSP